MYLHEDDRKRLEGKVLKPKGECSPKRSFIHDRDKGECGVLYQTSIRRAIRSQRMRSEASSATCHTPQEWGGEHTEWPVATDEDSIT